MSYPYVFSSVQHYSNMVLGVYMQSRYSILILLPTFQYSSLLIVNTLFSNVLPWTQKDISIQQVTISISSPKEWWRGIEWQEVEMYWWYSIEWREFMFVRHWWRSETTLWISWKYYYIAINYSFNLPSALSIGIIRMINTSVRDTKNNILLVDWGMICSGLPQKYMR